MIGIYISSYSIKDKSSGVCQKIVMQVNAMRDRGYTIEVPDFSTKGFFSRVWQKLPFVSTVYDYKVSCYLRSRSLDDVDFVYIRHGGATRRLIKTLYYLKKNHVKIIYEYPTFPYDRNENKIINTFVRKKDVKWRNYIKDYVSCVVDYSYQGEILGAKCIDISNGINVSEVLPQSKKSHKGIAFIGVGLLTYWNGYDRMIKAIHDYYMEDYKFTGIDVYFHIVGDGDELPNLKLMVDRLGVADKVYFYGFLDCDQLKEVYDISDIGVGTIAHFRKYKNHIMSTLKTKEYAAKGMPFLKSDPDPVFDLNKLDFIYNLSPNEEPFKITDIISWYEDLTRRHSSEELRDHIRSFADRELSWKKQLLPVFNHIEGNV